MKRRKFIQNTALLGASAGLTTQITGCGSSEDTVIDTHVIKNINISYIHNLSQSPRSQHDSLTPDEKIYLDTHFPNHSPSDTPHHHPNDELFLVNHNGVQKLTEIGSSSTNNGKTKKIFKSSNAKTYTYETTTVKENYAIHMFYKKINENNPFLFSNEDDIVQDSPPQYSLAALTLVVPDGSSSDESISFSNAPREIAKALIFSTPAFQHFSRDDLAYALSKFDDIFIGQFHGKTIKIRTHLENAINHVGTQNWYYYQAYRNKDAVATLRKTDSIDSNGNTIHKTGDPIYTFPLKKSLGIHLSNDLHKVIQYFSADERLSSVLLPVQTPTTTTKARVQKFHKKVLAKSSTHAGLKYTMHASSLKSEGLELTLNKVDNNGMHITAKNHYNRHSSLLVLHLDEGGFPVGSIQKVGILSPRYALMSIPLADFKKDFTITIPDTAHTSRFILGSLSFNNGHNKRLYEGSAGVRNRKKDIETILTDPEAYTIAFEMAIPSLLILWGANLNRGASFNKLLIILGAKFAYGIASPFFGNPNIRGTDAFLPILANIGTALLRTKNELAAVLIKDISEAEVEDSMPIAGQIARAINVAVDAANLGQTIYAVSTVNAINTVDVNRSHTLKLQLKSDPKDNDFPLNLSSVVVTLMHSQTVIEGSPYILDWDRTNVVSHTSDGGPTHSTYDLAIDDVPAGGTITVSVQLKIGHWIAAHKELGKVDNLAENTVVVGMKENLIPLGSSSIYQHYAKLGKSSGSYNWSIAQNNVFLASPSVSDASRLSNELFKISVNDPIGAIGYSYKDLNSNQYVIKNISAVLTTPNQGTKSISAENMMQLSYNLTASSSTDGHLVFEHKNGLTYVRSVDINSQSTDFKVNFAQNIGMFISDNISQFAYYPAQQTLAGLDTNLGVLHILRHLDTPRDDSDTNRYLNAQSMVKTRSIISALELDPKTQYLYTPQILTMSPSGDIIILEKTKDNNTRLRAFDQFAAVSLNFPGFHNGSGVFEFKKEAHSVNYLDINIESKGFIYVLKQLGDDASNEETYFLDIYDPQSSNPNTPIATTKGFSTAKIRVDYWRRVYALNYESTENNEPTISVWIPPVPS